MKQEKRKQDSLEQLMRRLTVITYHFIHNGAYMKYSIPATSYTDYESLKRDAYASVVGGSGGENNASNE